MEKNYENELFSELELIVRYAARCYCGGKEELNHIEKNMYSNKILEIVNTLNDEQLNWLYNEYSKLLDSINRLYDILKNYKNSSKETQEYFNNAYRNSDGMFGSRTPEFSYDENAQKSVLYVLEGMKDILNVEFRYPRVLEVFEFMNIFKNSLKNLIDSKDLTNNTNNNNNQQVTPRNDYIDNGVHYHYPNFDVEEHIQLK